ncbi:MAG: QacE family quaternary ammonium compound efflux SMR transporter, partial [Ignavibacteriales bacterium]|nr:QacE family quaternary ammonium compound efflux SMR transporter [Ignavibacteriales bacterium]
MVYWFILVLAGIFEVLWAIGLKLSQGFTNLFWSVTTIIGMALSMGMLAYVVKYLPLGTA